MYWLLIVFIAETGQVQSEIYYGEGNSCSISATTINIVSDNKLEGVCIWVNDGSEVEP